MRDHPLPVRDAARQLSIVVGLFALAGWLRARVPRRALLRFRGLREARSLFD